jgi:phosphopantetheine adenylyltransferase
VGVQYKRMMIKGFKEHYLKEAASEEVVITFGRFNPPTNGHEKLLDKVASVAKGSKYRVYASQSNDPKKNPLSFTDKVKFMRKMFPKHARAILMDKNVRNFFDALTIAHDDGFKRCTIVVGSDRVKEFDTVLNRYNGKKAKHGFYEFYGGVNVVSAGERDPDSDDVSGMSASKLRAAAKANDLIIFTKGMPKGFKGAKALMNAVRSGMGLKESISFRQDIKLKRASYLREKYVKGNLFKVEDNVVVVETCQTGIINKLCSNYVQVKLDESEEVKNFWLSDICLNKE